MTDAGHSIRMRVTALEGNKTSLRALIRHPMETGRRLSETEEPVPAHYIESLQIRRNDEVLISADWGTGIARNPSLRLTLRATVAGDAITIAWRDSQGFSDQRTVIVR